MMGEIPCLSLLAAVEELVTETKMASKVEMEVC